MANPRYDEDRSCLNDISDIARAITRETIAIVVVSTSVSELLDRPIAEALLRDSIDKLGGNSRYRRALVMTDATYRKDRRALVDLPLIIVGGPAANEEAKTLEASVGDGKAVKVQLESDVWRFRRTVGKEQIGLWGNRHNETRKSIELFVGDQREGLIDFLSKVWIQTPRWVPNRITKLALFP